MLRQIFKTDCLSSSRANPIGSVNLMVGMAYL
jgi:hypothetical protein